MPKTFTSVGMSCQTAHQLGRFATNNPDRIIHQKSPFDWLICPPAAIVSWLNDGLGDFQPKEIIIERDHAYWPKHGFWFWHWFYTKQDGRKVLDIEGNIERELSKLRYLRTSFKKCDPNSTTFVFSNIQNNLDEAVFSKTETEDYLLVDTQMNTMKSALESYFDSEIDLLLVSNLSRVHQAYQGNENLYFLPGETSEWKGNDPDWDKLISSLS